MCEYKIQASIAFAVEKCVNLKFKRILPSQWKDISEYSLSSGKICESKIQASMA